MQHTHWATSSSRPRSQQQAALGYLLFALALVNTVAAQGRIVGDSDPAVQYTPSELGGNFCVVDPFGEGCKDKWWQESITGAYLNSVKATGGPNTSLQLNFQGSMIQVKGVKERRGAQAFFSIDNATPITVDTNLPNEGDRQLGAVLWSFPGLDPKANHTLKIVYDPSSAGHKRPHLLRIDSFEITGGPAGDVVFPPPAASTKPPPASTNLPPPSTANPFPGTTPPATKPSDGTELTNGPIPTDTAEPSKSSSTPTIPIVAGISTGLATLVIASAVLFFLLRRRRAIRVKSMHLPRTSPPPGPNMSMAMGATRRPPSQGRRMMYPFTRRGSSTASSSDAPRPPPPAPQPPPTQPLPPVPQINPFVSPYTYQRGGPSYPRSDDTSSIGLPVDERPPNIPVPISPVAQSPRVLRVYNPDGSTVVSSGEDR